MNNCNVMTSILQIKVLNTYEKSQRRETWTIFLENVVEVLGEVKCDTVQLYVSLFLKYIKLFEGVGRNSRFFFKGVRIK